MVTLILLVLSACSTNNKVENEKTISKPKIESVFYDNLSDKNKKSIKFEFKEAQDETQDNTADPVYVVSMRVTNKTKKNVKFDKSKFLIFVTEQVKFKSSANGTLVVKPGKSATLHQLFENVAEQALVGGGSEFIYLNKDNKLADADFTNKVKTKQTDNSNQTSSNNQSMTTDNSSTNNTAAENGNSTEDGSDGNHVATGDAYDDDNPTSGWDESNLDPSHDGKRLDRILAWTEHYKQVGLEQGMSDEDAQSYGMNIAQEKENEYEERAQQ